MSFMAAELIALVASVLGAFFIATTLFKKILIKNITRLKLAGFLIAFFVLFVASMFALNFLLKPFLSHEALFIR
jgi:hypothetical protein